MSQTQAQYKLSIFVEKAVKKQKNITVYGRKCVT